MTQRGKYHDSPVQNLHDYRLHSGVNVVRAAHSLCSWSVQLAAPVVEPRSGLLIPPGVQYAKKKLALSYELFFEYGGEGGIDSLRSPCGQPTHCVRGLSNWLRQLSNPGRGFSSPSVIHITTSKGDSRLIRRPSVAIVRSPNTCATTVFRSLSYA